MHLRVRMNHPADAVWAELADFGGIARWSPDVVASSQIARRGITIGALREVTFTTNRNELMTVRERVVECGDRWFRYVLDGGIGPYKEAGSEWVVEPDGQGCTVTVRSYVRGAGRWHTLLTPLVHWHLKRGLQRALVGLERRVAV